MSSFYMQKRGLGKNPENTSRIKSWRLTVVSLVPFSNVSEIDGMLHPQNLNEQKVSELCYVFKELDRDFRGDQDDKRCTPWGSNR